MAATKNMLVEFEEVVGTKEFQRLEAEMDRDEFLELCWNAVEKGKATNAMPRKAKKLRYSTEPELEGWIECDFA